MNHSTRTALLVGTAVLTALTTVPAASADTPDTHGSPGTAAVGPNLVKNEDFSRPSVPPSSFTRAWPRFDQQLHPWTVTNGSVDIFARNVVGHPRIIQAANLAGGDNGTIAQTVSGIEAYSTYELTYDHRADPWPYHGCSQVANNLQRYTVSVTGARQASRYPPTSWEQADPITISTGDRPSNVQITFEAQTAPPMLHCGATVTNVSLHKITSKTN